MEPKECPVQPELLVQRVRLDLLVRRVLPARQVQLDHRVLVVQQVT